MTKYLAIVLTTAALAACGSKSSSTSSTPTAPTSPAPDRDQADSASDGAALAPPTTPPEAPPAVAIADPAAVQAELLASERAAWDAAKPAFDKACAACHTSAGKKAGKKKLDHFNFDRYPLQGHHAGTIGATIRDVLGISGKKPTMPAGKPGSVQGDDLATIKAWIDAWEAADKAGAHPPAAPGDHED